MTSADVVGQNKHQIRIPHGRIVYGGWLNGEKSKIK